MAQLFFSLSALLKSELVLEDGTSIGSLLDVIADKETGALTFFLVEATEYQQTEGRQLYAIHHSFFKLLSNDSELVFSPSFGEEGKKLAKASVPEYYQSSRIGDYKQFQSEILKDLTGAGHRSDNQVR